VRNLNINEWFTAGEYTLSGEVHANDFVELYNADTLPVALANLLGEHVQDTELMMAGSVLTILPVMLLFIVVQRAYIEGITAGSLKD